MRANHPPYRTSSVTKARGGEYDGLRIIALTAFWKSRRLLIAQRPSDNRLMIGIKRRSGLPLVVPK
jgi:hypothetical protein